MAVHQGTHDRRYRGLWMGLTLPGAIALLVLFVAPFYVMLSVAGGGINEFFQTVVPVWNPLHWSSWNLSAVWHDIFGHGSFIGGAAVRTLIYTAIATAISLAIAYPVAYFVSRYGGRRKTLFLVLLIAPFWVSYMMRMLAWIDLLQQGGFVNSALSFFGLPGNTDWLGGKSVTVILGLVYGYIPYVILVLYAFLDRIDQSLIEAARDLGLSRWRTFWHVTLRLSKPAIIAGTFITALPMLGDYFTNQLMSGAPGTTMIGNAIEGLLEAPGETGQGAVLALMVLVVLLIPMLYYVISTARSSRDYA
ncbi:MAG TPA: ABC transporter permease [Solirubrobacteraceae bacterium]|jgi:spermidine/putrescine transport system permease protein|nr:ABC transporter permease [Solirubrobacteraceae bacterium]